MNYSIKIGILLIKNNYFVKQRNCDWLSQVDAEN